MHRAVEVNVAQARRIGASANLYIVEGMDVAYVHSDRDRPNAIQCDITTRVTASKNRVGYLEPTQIPIDGLDPRPNHSHQWEKHTWDDNRWYRR